MGWEHLLHCQACKAGVRALGGVRVTAERQASGCMRVQVAVCFCFH